jgi:hypothetical protein
MCNRQIRVGGTVYNDTFEIILPGAAPLRKAEMFWNYAHVFFQRIPFQNLIYFFLKINFIHNAGIQLIQFHSLVYDVML